MHSKAWLRQRILESIRHRAAAGPEPSQHVLARLQAVIASRRPAAVAGYMAFAAEVDIRSVLEGVLDAGCELWLPRYCRAAKRYEMIPVHDLAGDLVAGWYGIHEPSPELAAVDERARTDDSVLWLVPGLAFDPDGHRLGRGKGFYDRLLEGARGTRVGICWDWQIVEEIPAAAHDVGMDRVVTDQRTLRCGK